MARPNLKASIAHSFMHQPATADPDLRTMMHLHENSENASLFTPVNLGNHQCDPTESISPRAAVTLKRSHWKSVDDAKCCSEPTCRRKFDKKLARFELRRNRRNCYMCGLVYCRGCTPFRRKLSADAVPDPQFGSPCPVCRSCFEKDAQEDVFDHDWTDVFHYFREQGKGRKERMLHEKSGGVPLSSTSGAQKRERVRSELDRLCTGFEANHGVLKDLFADFKIPQWQKSGHWVNSARKQICQDCNQTFKRMAKKVNCRVCGQVYCSKCTKDEIIMYIPNGQRTAEWFINGKEGGPQQMPTSFQQLPVCNLCCQDLQAIILEKISESCSVVSEIEETDFMDSLVELHRGLVRMKQHIEAKLPNFQKFVDSMDIADGSSRSVSGKSPINELARVTCDLSDQFSNLAFESQNLRRLEPTSNTQCRLLKYVCRGTYQFYDDNMYTFRVTRQRLKEMMPIDTLTEIQSAINQRSLEVVHILVKQICFEAINVELHQRVPCDSFTSPLSRCVDTLELELSEIFTEKDLDWNKHARTVSEFLKGEMSGPKRKLKLSKVPKNHFRNVIVQQKLLKQCSTYLKRSLRELDAKTPMNAFPSSKGEIRQLAVEFEDRAAQFLKTHPQAFPNTRK